MLLPLLLLQQLLQGEYHIADSQQSVCLSFTNRKICVWLLAALNDSILCLMNVDDGIQWKYLEGSKTVTVIVRTLWPENVICASAGLVAVLVDGSSQGKGPRLVPPTAMASGSRGAKEGNQ